MAPGELTTAGQLHMATTGDLAQCAAPLSHWGHVVGCLSFDAVCHCGYSFPWRLYSIPHLAVPYPARSQVEEREAVSASPGPAFMLCSLGDDWVLGTKALPMNERGTLVSMVYILPG